VDELFDTSLASFLDADVEMVGHEAVSDDSDDRGTLVGEHIVRFDFPQVYPAGAGTNIIHHIEQLQKASVVTRIMKYRRLMSSAVVYMIVFVGDMHVPQGRPAGKSYQSEIKSKSNFCYEAADAKLRIIFSEKCVLWPIEASILFETRV